MVLIESYKETIELYKYRRADFSVSEFGDELIAEIVIFSGGDYFKY